MNHADTDAMGLTKRERGMFEAVKRIMAQDGVVGKEQLIRGVIESDGNFAVQTMTPKLRRQAILKYRRYMDKSPNLRQAMATIFVEYAEFTPEEAVQLHVQHIRGLAPQNANYQALKDYEAMVFPQQAKQLNIKQQTAIAHVSIEDTHDHVGPPPMAPRSIGPAKVERDES